MNTVLRDWYRTRGKIPAGWSTPHWSDHLWWWQHTHISREPRREKRRRPNQANKLCLRFGFAQPWAWGLRDEALPMPWTRTFWTLLHGDWTLRL